MPSPAWRMAWPSSTGSGSAPPSAFAASSASIQPLIAPGTVRAASGPRDGNGVVVAIEFRPRVLAGPARRHQRAHAPRRLAHQPEAVAADAVHVRIDDGDRRRHRDHRLERIAAFGEDRASGFRRRAMRRADDAAAMSGGVRSMSVASLRDAVLCPLPLRRGRLEFWVRGLREPYPLSTFKQPLRRGEGAITTPEAALVVPPARAALGRRQPAAERGVERFRIARAAGGIDVLVAASSPSPDRRCRRSPRTPRRRRRRAPPTTCSCSRPRRSRRPRTRARNAAGGAASRSPPACRSARASASSKAPTSKSSAIRQQMQVEIDQRGGDDIRPWRSPG